MTQETRDTKSTAVVVVAVLAVFVLTGCGGSDRPPSYQVSGTATYGGQPIVAGQIIFEPDPVQGNAGPQGVARIENGRYQTLPNRGSIPGAVILIVRGYTGEPHPENAMGLPLFPPFQLSAELPRQDTIFEVDVPATHCFD